MKAVRYHATGGPEVLSYEEAATPTPGKGEALVRVEACGVNRIDIWARSGRYKTALPHILGTDIAGVVESTGSDVGGVRVGSRVVVYPVLSDGTCVYCRQGSPSRCLARGFVGVAADGGYAEFVKVPAANLISADGIDPEKAAAMPVDFGTAWRGLVSRANVGPEDTVLIWGAAGGLGHAAIQIAKLRGATVIAAIGDESKSQFVKSQGADHVVQYKSTDVPATVRSLTDGLGASVVFDHVGGDTWGRSIDSLARGGRLLTLGLTSGPNYGVDVRQVYSDEISIMGTYGQSKADIEEVLRLEAEGKLRPSIQSELPLSSAQEAHRILESREIRGKVVLLP
jgi:NADPH:quinone reductase-like Zn-dependent oxidoreductase